MRALVKQKPEPGLWLEEQPVPEIGPDDVLVRVHKTGICGTDVHIFNWDEWAQKTIPVPLTVGHEFVGEVAEVVAVEVVVKIVVITVMEVVMLVGCCGKRQGCDDRGKEEQKTRLHVLGFPQGGWRLSVVSGVDNVHS